MDEPYKNIEAMCHELAESVPRSGWNMWVDTSNGEPFDIWLTPPGEPVLWNRHILTSDFIFQLDQFNPDKQRLLPNERLIVASEFIRIWFSNDVASKVVDTAKDSEGYIHHFAGGKEILAKKISDDIRLSQLDDSILSRNDAAEA